MPEGATVPEAAPADTFRIGLAFAGAISAGAYTAGVMDFLVQALEEWDKQRGQETAARHHAVVKVIAGASAGAITGALGVVALARDAQPEMLDATDAASFNEPGTSYQPVRCVLPQLYTTWVRQPRLVATNGGGTDLLSLEDLVFPKGRQPCVGSVLNATLLDRIKESALASPGPPNRRRPYLAEPLHVYMTVSNLRGIPFTVGFGNSSYGMQTHGDRIHYTVAGVGKWSCQGSAWLDGEPSPGGVAADSSIAIDVATLPGPGQLSQRPEWDAYGTAALASSAFPVGLASRSITTPFLQYDQRKYPMDVQSGFIKNDLARRYPKGTDYTFLNVDGGLINNNPFEYAEYALLGPPSSRSRLPASETEAAVIMVAPFPEPPALVPEGRPQAEVVALLRALMPTLINQTRFKPNELVQAIDPDNYSRYLIAPHRVLPGKSEGERYTIACGALGGFGGFLDEAFRAHDFQLGRRNCQRFLATMFSLPKEARVLGVPPGATLLPAVDGRPAEAPVIPLHGTASLEVALPHWPRMTKEDFRALMDRVKGRLTAVLPVLIQSQTASAKLRMVGRIATMLGTRQVLEFAKFSILSDLVRRDQIEDWTLPDTLADQGDDVRLILAELAGPSFDYRTVEGLAAATHLDPAFIAATLATLQTLTGNLQVVTAPRDPALFTLTIRKETGFWSLPGVSLVGRWVDPPSDDRPRRAA